MPGGTLRQLRTERYGDKIGLISESRSSCCAILQTSGGLLVAVAPTVKAEFLAVAAELGLKLAPIGD